MTYVERMAARTTGVALIAAMSVVPGLVLGLMFLASGEVPAGEAFVMALFGPIAVLLLLTPLRWVFVQASKIPFSIFFVGPVLLAYLLFVKPTVWLALKKQWVVLMD